MYNSAELVCSYQGVVHTNAVAILITTTDCTKSLHYKSKNLTFVYSQITNKNVYYILRVCVNKTTEDVDKQNSQPSNVIWFVILIISEIKFNKSHKT